MKLLFVIIPALLVLTLIGAMVVEPTAKQTTVSVDVPLQTLLANGA